MRDGGEATGAIMAELGCKHGHLGSCTACTNDARKDALQEIDAALHDAGYRTGAIQARVRQALADLSRTHLGTARAREIMSEEQ